MDNRVAFVTGASRGIGKACAIALAAAGFDVACTTCLGDPEATTRMTAFLEAGGQTREAELGGFRL